MDQGRNSGPQLQQAVIGVVIIASVVWAVWYGGATPRAGATIDTTASPPSPVSAMASATPRPAIAQTAAVLPKTTAATTATARPSSTATIAATATATATPAPVVHTIKAGEILVDVAAKYNITADEIMALNHITDPTTLQIGQKLLIPVTATPLPAPTAPTTPKPTPVLVFQTLNAGDTLLALAQKFNVSVDLIMMVNPMLDPNNLQIGQKVLIPPADGDLPDPVVWAPQIDYQVSDGDTLLDIAITNGSSLEDILAVNPGLEPTTILQIGQTLKVPLTRPRPRNGGGEAAPAANRPPAPSLSDADVAALKSGSPTLVGLEAEMVKAVNAERAAHNLPPYAIDAQLTTMAWSQAHDMVTRGYFSHITPEGSTLRDRFRDRKLSTNWVGENIYLSVKPADQAVASTINWFMGDAPHRRNILHQNFNRVGVGVAQGESGWYTFVLDFAGD